MPSLFDVVQALVAAVVVVVLLIRWITSTRPARRVLAPVFVTGLLGALQDWTRTASSYQALGTVALQRRQLDQAARHLHHAIDVWKNLGDQRNVAGTYNLLGLAMHQHGRLAEAERYYRDGIALGEALADHTNLAAAYVQLGTVVEARGDARRRAGVDDSQRPPSSSRFRTRVPGSRTTNSLCWTGGSAARYLRNAGSR